MKFKEVFLNNPELLDKTNSIISEYLIINKTLIETCVNDDDLSLLERVNCIINTWSEIERVYKFKDEINGNLV